jgi:gliding motility-associated-like protein
MLRFFKVILFFVAFSVSFGAWATHVRGGEITYEYVGNRYRFVITLCNDEDGLFGAVDSNPIDISVIADNLTGKAFRVSPNPVPGVFQETVFEFFSDRFVDDNGTPGDTSDDRIVALGNGTHVITVLIFDRNAGILNINGGDSEMGICLETMLVIGDPSTGGFNNSVVFDNDICPEIACAGQPYCFNPLAVDPDGDSLAYSLTIPKGDDCFSIGTYSNPNFVGGGNISIDSRTGTICWDSPQVAGDYVFVVKVEEYRGGILVGYVKRDIQLTIRGNCSNFPPTLNPISDTCIIAGESFTLPVSATDPDGNTVFLTASGLPFSLTPPAEFNILTQGATSTAEFSWDTNCSHIPLNPYNYVVTVEASDLSSTPPLSNYQTFYVRVVPPHVTGINATALGDDATITWNTPSCPGFIGFKVYRFAGSAPPADVCCEPNAALGLGYELIGTINNPNIRSFVDSDLDIGIEYCYTVTALYRGSVESCPIEFACVLIKKDLPVITHVSVNITGGDGVGEDTIKWSNPVDLDLAVFPGPYFYRVYFGEGNNPANTLIHTTPQVATIPELDTVHAFITNTEARTNSFRIELWWNNSGTTEVIGSTKKATSIFLRTAPNDNQVTLTWTEDVPWNNFMYEVYRADAFGGPFVLIGTTTVQRFVDTGLINGREYCYKVLGFGEYDTPSIIRPLLNWSQIKCETPTDLTPPCPPELTIDSDCINGVNALTWTNPNNSCADDVTHYNIYYAPFEGDSLQLITSINSGDDSNANDTTFTYNFLSSVAGCYAVTAIDSLKYGNESVFSNIVCIDNCPIYELPNVFSPDGQGLNNLFHPLYPYRNVESVNFTVYNRWGQIIFHTTDPELGWDGTHKNNGLPVPEGTYYYICEVNFVRLAGIVPLKPALSGYITIFRNK